MTPNMIRAFSGPTATSATSTATVPETKAPTRGTNAPMKTSTPMALTNGTPRTTAPSMMPAASVAATSTVARTNWVSEAHATRPEESAWRRAARGKIRTSQAQIRLAVGEEEVRREQHDEGSGEDVAERDADLAEPSGRVLAEALQLVLGALQRGVQLGVGDVQGAGAQPRPDLVDAAADLVREVAHTGGDLVAHEGEQQRQRGDAEQHDEQRGELAADADPVHPGHEGSDQRRQEQRDHQRQHHDEEEVEQPEDHSHGAHR